MRLVTIPSFKASLRLDGSFLRMIVQRFLLLFVWFLMILRVDAVGSRKSLLVFVSPMFRDLMASFSSAYEYVRELGASANTTATTSSLRTNIPVRMNCNTYTYMYCIIMNYKSIGAICIYYYYVYYIIHN